MTLYELLTGVLPITGSNNYEIMMGHINQAPVPPHQRSPPGAAADIRGSDAGIWPRIPAQRFATAEEFLQALQIGPAVRESGLAYTAPLPTTNPSGARRMTGRCSRSRSRRAACRT